MSCTVALQRLDGQVAIDGALRQSIPQTRRTDGEILPPIDRLIVSPTQRMREPVVCGMRAFRASKAT